MQTIRRTPLFFLAAIFAVTPLPAVAQTLIDTVQVGKEPNWVAINPVTNRIYVPNLCPDFCSYFNDSTVSVIDGTPPTALQFVSLTPPCRAVDTRPEHGGSGPIQGGTFQNFGISGAGTCGTLASAAAYSSAARFVQTFA